MPKKFLITFLIILILIFSFAITCYASTDYSVYSEENNGYFIQFPEGMKKKLGLPSIDVPCYMNTENIYYVLYKGADGFLHMAITNSVLHCNIGSPGNSYIIRQLNYSPFFGGNWIFNETKNSWSKSFGSSITIPSLDSVLVSSDDIYNHSTSELMVSKTIYEDGSLLTRTINKMDFYDNSVLKEIVSILPVTLTIVVIYISIRKGISFIRKKMRTA